jgi:hypothetical protein
MVARLFGTVAALAVLAALAIGAVAYAANSPSSTPSAPSSAPSYSMPAAAHSHSGNCPNMGGDSSSPSSSGASQSDL